jgi:V/A-type H+-transporting ATPase subunit D
MAEIKLNKTELKIQKSLLDQLVKFLPTLQLKKQQLQGEVELVRSNVEKLKNEIEKISNEIEPWAILLSQHLTSNIDELVVLEEIISERENIAGVDVPVFKEVIFQDVKYSYLVMPVWIDKAVMNIKDIIELREILKIGKKRLELLEEELRQTSIKVNLFEKRMIPDCKGNIKKIKIFLGDQEIAAICNAKIAKDKLKRKEQLQAEAV